METERVAVSDFKARCTALLRDLAGRPRRIEVTNHGRVIAVVTAPSAEARPDPAAWLGSLRGTVLRQEEPSVPAVEGSEWDVIRD
jgi:antitoxin (DNA-binding transcriptional repressor) of toxin-antitoxin stability system